MRRAAKPEAARTSMPRAKLEGRGRVRREPGEEQEARAAARAGGRRWRKLRRCTERLGGGGRGIGSVDGDGGTGEGFLEGFGSFCGDAGFPEVDLLEFAE
jgi:hypothetical protein